MKKHAKKLLALVMAFALCLGVAGTTTAATGKKNLSATYKNIGIIPAMSSIPSVMRAAPTTCAPASRISWTAL